MGKVNVIIVDATGNKEQKVGLPDDIKCGIIMVKLVEKIKLPSVGPDGNPISYKFIHKVTGRQLLESQTLGEAGIKDGDVLRLQPEITAGVTCPACGRAINGNETFCPGCGTSLSVSQLTNNYAPIQNSYVNQKEKSNKLARVFIIILGIISSLILLITGFSLVGLSSVSGTSVAEAYYNGIGYALIAGSLLSVAATIHMVVTIKK